MPRSHSAGRTDSGPKKPKLPSSRLSRIARGHHVLHELHIRPRHMGRGEAAVGIVEIGPEIVEVGDAEKRAEGVPHDRRPFVEITGFERSDDRHRASPRGDNRRRADAIAAFVAGAIGAAT